MNFLPNYQMLDLSKLKGSADDNIKVVKKLNLYFEGKKTLWGEDKNRLVNSIFFLL